MIIKIIIIITSNKVGLSPLSLSFETFPQSIGQGIMEFVLDENNINIYKCIKNKY